MMKDMFVEIFPGIVTALLAALSIFLPSIQSAITAHPVVAVLIGAAYAILKWLMPSPTAQLSATRRYMRGGV